MTALDTTLLEVKAKDMYREVDEEVVEMTVEDPRLQQDHVLDPRRGRAVRGRREVGVVAVDLDADVVFEPNVRQVLRHPAAADLDLTAQFPTIR